MTHVPAAPAMTTLAEAIRPGVPRGVPNAVARTVVRTVVPVVVPAVVRTVVRTVVWIEVLEAGLIARDSAVVRCWRRGSRGCQSRPSPKA